MRAAVLRISLAAVLVAPTAAAFVSGGYFDQARLVLALAAWLLVLVVAALAPIPLPRSRAGLAAVGGLVLLAGWVLASMAWAPLPGGAWDDAQRVALYAGGLLAACGLLRDRAGRLAVEPALVGGALVLALYALSERLLPGVFELEQSRSALGRLDQPLTYWNAEGSVMAVALVLAVRMLGTPERPRALRAGAAVAVPWIALALYLTLSRGALAAAGIGVIALALLDSSRVQAKAIALGVAAGVVTVAAAEAFPGVLGSDGNAGDGAVVLVVLLAVSAVGAAIAIRWTGSAAPARDPRRVRTVALPAILLAVVALGALVVISGAGREPPGLGGASEARADRLRSLGSNRDEYWRVAFDVAAAHPLVGHGSGSFDIDWSRERTITEGVRDAHSLIIETAAELGVVGLLLLALFLGGVAASVPAALRRDPVLAVGATAGLVAWVLHAQLDWLWEMPAATLNAVLLAALVVTLADPVQEDRNGDGGQQHDDHVGGVT